MIVFFFGSAAASAAYLTVSELFPLEVGALAIALFYAIGTGIGGVGGPFLLGHLIDSGSRTSVLVGYLIGSALMIAAAIIAAFWATAAEQPSPWKPSQDRWRRPSDDLSPCPAVDSR